MEIQPDKQNLDQTFSTTVYFIDFYQRDYKWTEDRYVVCSTTCSTSSMKP